MKGSGRTAVGKWILTGFTLSAFIVAFYYQSFHSFKKTITTNFNNHQEVVALSMRNLIIDHLRDTYQDLGHIISMITETSHSIDEASRSIDLFLAEHSDNFIAISLVSDSEIIHTTPADLHESLGPSITAYAAALGQLRSPFISERTLTGDMAATHIFIPFRVSGQERAYFLVGSITLRSYVKSNIPSLQAQDLRFLLADQVGDIYLIAHMKHEKHGSMERGNIFDLKSSSCTDCHRLDHFDDVKKSFDSGTVIHSIQTTPDGEVLNRTTIPFSLFNESWTLSVSSPYKDTQGAIDRSFQKSALYTLLSLAVTVLFGFLMYSTQKKKAVLEERASNEEKLRDLLDSVPAGIFEISLDGVFTSANRHLADLLGYLSPDDLLGLSIDSLYQDDGEREDFFKFIPEGGTIRDGIMVLRKKGGGTFIASCSAAGRFDERGRLDGIRGYILDLTEKIEAEREVRRSEERYRALFDGSDDGIYLLRRDGESHVFSSVNPRGVELLGGSSTGALEKRSLLDFAPIYQPNGQPSSALLSREVSSALGGKTRSFEWFVKKTDGREFPCEITISPIEVEGEIFLQTVMRDITERKKADLDRLRIDKLKSISTLAGGIAHDFNNLLSGIMGNIGLAKLLLKADHPNTEELSKALANAEKSSDKAANLTSRMLAFYKKGTTPFRRKISNLEELIREDAEMALHGSNVAVEYRFEEDLPPIHADADQIGQVVHNLVKNAKESMPEGGVVAIRASARSLSSHPILDPGQYVEISFRDDGAGIPKEDINQIFDAYYTTKSDGQGLGLASVYNIIRQHDGHITVESSPGRGTTFTLFVPSATEARIKKEAPVDGADAVGMGERILIIDDDRSVGNTMCSVLREIGYNPAFYDNSDEAIEAFRRVSDSGRPFHLVITDLTLPNDRNGLHIKEEIRRIDGGAKVILTSGYLMHPIMSGSEDHGFDATLPKPVSISKLSSTVRKVLSS